MNHALTPTQTQTKACQATDKIAVDFEENYFKQGELAKQYDHYIAANIPL